ncbi:hypothetical protein OQA88_11235 [Cercophora sp. LCS_1]
MAKRGRWYRGRGGRGGSNGSESGNGNNSDGNKDESGKGTSGSYLKTLREPADRDKVLFWKQWDQPHVLETVGSELNWWTPSVDRPRPTNPFMAKVVLDPTAITALGNTIIQQGTGFGAGCVNVYVEFESGAIGHNRALISSDPSVNSTFGRNTLESPPLPPPSAGELPRDPLWNNKTVGDVRRMIWNNQLTQEGYRVRDDSEDVDMDLSSPSGTIRELSPVYTMEDARISEAERAPGDGLLMYEFRRKCKPSAAPNAYIDGL